MSVLAYAPLKAASLQKSEDGLIYSRHEVFGQSAQEREGATARRAPFQHTAQGDSVQASEQVPCKYPRAHRFADSVSTVKHLMKLS